MWLFKHFTVNIINTNSHKYNFSNCWCSKNVQQSQFMWTCNTWMGYKTFNLWSIHLVVCSFLGDKPTQYIITEPKVKKRQKMQWETKEFPRFKRWNQKLTCKKNRLHRGFDHSEKALTRRRLSTLMLVACSHYFHDVPLCCLKIVKKILKNFQLDSENIHLI